MRFIISLLLLLLICSAEARKGPRSKDGERGPAGKLKGIVRGRGRAGVMRRQTQECTEYTEAGEKYLDCQGRQLTSVMQNWPRDIQHLILSRNKFKVLRDNMFAQFKKLKSLDLQQNAIFMVEDHAFSGLSKLTTLLLQHNNLKSVSEEVLVPMPHLIYLRIYDNPWSCQCPLDGLVRFLQVPSNRNLGNYAKCAEPASLKGEKLKTLKADVLCDEGTKAVDEEDPPATLPSIKKNPEAMSLCRVQYFPQPRMDCSNKNMSYIPSEMPSEMHKIDLSRNGIKHLRPKQFLLSKDLKTLNLSSNNLQQIDTAAFSGLLHLHDLDLSNNSLRYFQYGVLEDLYFLRTLLLDNNPWTCDYNIHYLVYWLKLHPGVSYRGLFCSHPAEFRGWRVEDYVKTYNGECPIDKQTEGIDNEAAEHGGSENEVQGVMGEMAEGQGILLPQPIKKKEPSPYEIIRLS
ncbi:leucine-rich repeat-containing protein 17 [Oryzias latipes]|uniref:Leucine rich repeat containing 17 n=1 Tax=Oryzias latipes TaxID=8090 RepID=H2MD40_ORYLA|nr:leucine-rich repeat-containing protein 17 [Oryzias latipes]XP_023808051.1 leucine-rich repeat-containing protein 17 [Oryzias latipes]